MNWSWTINPKRRSTVILLCFLFSKHGGCYWLLLLRLLLLLLHRRLLKLRLRLRLRCGSSSESSVSGSRSTEKRNNLLEAVNSDVSHRSYLRLILLRRLTLTDQFKKLLHAVNPCRRSFSQSSVFHFRRRGDCSKTVTSTTAVAVHHQLNRHLKIRTPLQLSLKVKGDVNTEIQTVSL